MTYLEKAKEIETVLSETEIVEEKCPCCYELESFNDHHCYIKLPLNEQSKKECEECWNREYKEGS